MKRRKLKRSQEMSDATAGKQRSAYLMVEDGPVSVPIYCRKKTVRGAEYTVFEVADYSEGYRRLRSFSDEEKAVKEAERLAGLMRKGDSEGLKLDGESRAIFVRAVEHLRPTGIALDVAAKLVADMVKILEGDHCIEAARYYAKRHPARMPRKSVKEAVDEFIASKTRAGRSGRHVQDLKYRLNALAGAFNCSLSAVSGTDLKAWIEKMDLSARSKEHFRNKAGTFFRWCQRSGYLPKDWDEMEQVEKLKVVDGEVGIFTPDEASRLLRAADKHFLPALAIQLFAGLRTAEVERLRWDDVNLAERFITVRSGTAKTASRRVVPVVDALAAWLEKRTRKSGLVWGGGKTTICDAQRDTARATGNKRKKLAPVKWKHNAPRHSFISYRLAGVKNANQVALEAGNSTAMIFKHYRELVREADAMKYFAVTPERPANVTALKTVVTSPVTSSVAA